MAAIVQDGYGSGTVVAAGPDVTRFSVGDEVFGFGRGTFAEYAAAAPPKPTWCDPWAPSTSSTTPKTTSPTEHAATT
jgi:NADPH:quinone reductase-like Zn-dependent oxidoreductase